AMRCHQMSRSLVRELCLLCSATARYSLIDGKNELQGSLHSPIHDIQPSSRYWSGSHSMTVWTASEKHPANCEEYSRKK
ncbi:hypothetical protein TELCIR_25634, partial [Teladorsagia circumcincta]